MISEAAHPHKVAHTSWVFTVLQVRPKVVDVTCTLRESQRVLNVLESVHATLGS